MKIGVVLSGGGARGIAHIGVMGFLEEKGVKIDYLSGVSAGAIVGAFHAAGYSFDRMVEILKTINLFQIMRPSFSGGIFKMDKIALIFEKHLPSTFEALKIPLWISATEIYRGKTVFFQQGDLYHPLIASSCMPMIFKPIVINNMTMVDGGMLNNLPVEPLIDKCDKIIGIHVNPNDTKFTSSSITKITQRCIELSVKCNVEDRKKYCQLFVEPSDLQHYTMLDLSKMNDMLEIGYNAIKSVWSDSFLD